MLIVKEEKGRIDREIFVELTRNRGLSITDCDRLGYWCDKPHLKHFIPAIASVFTSDELEEIFVDILKKKEPKIEPKIGDWCIFWDYKNEYACVGVLTHISSSKECYQRDSESSYVNAVTWNGTREHLEKVRRGEV